jgi:hypothetical protein
MVVQVGAEGGGQTPAVATAEGPNRREWVRNRTLATATCECVLVMYTWAKGSYSLLTYHDQEG